MRDEPTIARLPHFDCASLHIAIVEHNEVGNENGYDVPMVWPSYIERWVILDWRIL
jgi:hypothetical protein